MFKRLTILWFIFTSFMVLIPSSAHATAIYRPKGYYYRSGRWYPYHGRGYPYRGGYYDRWGRWHLYRY
jgi:hypothetical protein